MGFSGKEEFVSVTGVVIPTGWSDLGRVTDLGLAAAGETNYLVSPEAEGPKLFALLGREVTVRGKTRGAKPNQTLIVERVEMRTGKKGEKWSLLAAVLVCAGFLMASVVGPAFAAQTTATDAKPAVKAEKAQKSATKKAKSKKKIKPNATVKSAQTALTKAGFKCTADGIMGKKTKAALKKFQKKNGLKVTGKLDKATKAKLGV